MMDCEQAVNSIDAWVDDELDAQARRLLDDHLGRCDACRAAVEAARAGHAELRRVFAPRRTTAALLVDRVLASLPADLPAARPRRWRWVGPLAAGFLLAVAVFRPWRQPPLQVAELQPAPGTVRITDLPPMAARVIVASGSLEVFSPSRQSWAACSTSDSIEQGSSVRTGDQAACGLAAEDGTRVGLSSQTQVRFESDHLLELATGQLWSAVAATGRPFEVKTSNAAIVAGGGQFCLDCSTDATHLTVVEGEATVREPGGARVVAAGERAKIVNGAVIETTQLADPILDTSWVHAVLALEPHNEELSRRVDMLVARIGEAKMHFLYEDEIRRLGNPVVDPLVRFIENSSPHDTGARRAAAARIVADVAQPRSIPDLIALAADVDPQVRVQAARGLARLTGRDLGLAPEQWEGDWQSCESAHNAWRQWWSDNKHLYPANARLLDSLGRLPAIKKT